MKKVEGFFESLERYLRKSVERSALPQYWQWVLIGLVIITLGSSVIGAKNSMAGARDVREVIKKAAERGDYATARRIYESCTVPQCHSDTDLVYPERKIEQKIAELEVKLGEYPGNRQIYLGLADLYGQIGDWEKSGEYREKARILDPNDLKFQ